MDGTGLVVLAQDTNRDLNTLWDDIGVAEGERFEFLEGIVQAVRDVYRSRVASQEERKEALEREIAQLGDTISSMQNIMAENVAMVRGRAQPRAGSHEIDSPGRHRSASGVLTLRTRRHSHPCCLQPDRGTFTLLEYRSVLEAKRCELQKVRRGPSASRAVGATARASRRTTEPLILTFP